MEFFVSATPSFSLDLTEQQPANKETCLSLAWKGLRHKTQIQFKFNVVQSQQTQV